MNDTWKKIERIFGSICWITAISFTLFCLYNFGLDKDLCTISYKSFYQNEEDVFPAALSLCFKNPFIGNDLGKLYNDGNETSLLKYLEGTGDMPHILNLRYKNLDMNVNKYVLLGSLAQWKYKYRYPEK